MAQPFDDTTKIHYRHYFEMQGIRAISQWNYLLLPLARGTKLAFHVHHTLIRNPNRSCLLCFLLLNGLLFLPLYLLNWTETTLLPIPPTDTESWQLLLHGLLIDRDNFDPFRVNLELVLLIILWVNLRWLRRPMLRPLFIGAYFFVLGYYIYEAITLSIYQADPVFYNHYFLAIDGLGYLFTHLNVSMGLYIVVILLVMVVVWGIYRLVSHFYQTALLAQWTIATRLILLGVGVLILFVLTTQQGALAAPSAVVNSFSYKLEQNITKSIQLHQQVTSFDDDVLQAAYDYSNFALTHKPNLYLLFVESYGSVLYKRPDYRIAYALLLKRLKRQLAEAGWNTASALSDAPTWGGGSWLGYTSAQFGLRIDTHPYYLTLLNKYQYERYPHLGNFLQEQGYKTYRLSSLKDTVAEEEWTRYERFYDVDRWFRFKDIDYDGPLIGWGPALPDQYALHYTHEQITQNNEQNQPFLFFFITQNSHYPYAPLPPLVEEWRTLAAISEQQAEIDDENREHAVRRQDYFDAIDYSLTMLVQFILQNTDDDALFVIIGDHQPPRVSRRADGFDTPVHMISRNNGTISAVQEHGFTPGLWVNEKEPMMKHEGLYSLLVRALLRGGENKTALPPYLPDGFVMNVEGLDE